MLLMVLGRWPAVRCQKKHHAAGGIPHYPRLTLEASCAEVDLIPCHHHVDTLVPPFNRLLACSVLHSPTQTLARTLSVHICRPAATSASSRWFAGEKSVSTSGSKKHVCMTHRQRVDCSVK